MSNRRKTKRDSFATRVEFGSSGRKLLEVRRRHNGPWALATGDPYLEVEAYGFQNDGAESGTLLSQDSQQTLDTDTIYFVRFRIKNTGTYGYKNLAVTFEYNHNSGGWTTLDEVSTVAQGVASSNVAQYDDCTEKLSGGSGTWVSDNDGVAESGGDCGGSNLDLDVGYYAEVLCVFQINSAYVSDGDEVLLRPVISGGTPFDNYPSGEADVDVNEAVVPIERTASDSMSLTDSNTRAVILERSASDTLSLSDQVASACECIFEEAVADGVTLSDANARELELERNANDSLTLSDEVERAAVFSRAVEDTLTLTDQTARTLEQGGSIERELNDTVTLTDSQERGLILVRDVNDTATLAEQNARGVIFERAVNDTMTLRDSDDFTMTWGPGVSTDTILAANIEDTWIYQNQPSNNYGDSVAIQCSPHGGGAGSRYGLVRITNPETNIPDGKIVGFRFCFKPQANYAEIVRAFRCLRLWEELDSNWVYYDDSESDAWSTGGAMGEGTDYDSEIGGNVHCNSNTSFKKIQLPTDWATNWRDGSDPNGGIKFATVIFYMVAWSSENASANKPYFEVDYIPPISRELDDTVTLSDEQSREMEIGRAANDAATLSDQSARSLVLERQVNDTLSGSDSVDSALALSRETNDSLNLTDSNAREMELVRAASDVASLSDESAAEMQGTLVREVNDTLSLTDVVDRYGIWTRTASDAMSLSDETDVAWVLVREASDSLSLTDATGRDGTFSRAAQDALSLSDDAEGSILGTIIRAVEDVLSLLDESSRASTVNRVVSDSLSLVDDASSASVLQRSVDDTATLADELSRAVAYVRELLDSVSLTDEAARSLITETAIERSIEDVLSLADEVERQLWQKLVPPLDADVTSTRLDADVDDMELSAEVTGTQLEVEIT